MTDSATKTKPKSEAANAQPQTDTQGAAATSTAAGPQAGATGTASNVTPLPGATGAKTADTGTLSPQPAAVAPSGLLSRNDATRAMTAVDELRKRTVKELRLLTASINRNPDEIKSIELKQKQRYLDDLADLHKTIGEAFGLGGY